MVALTGAPAPARVGSRTVAHLSPLVLRDGDACAWAAPPAGLRSYCSVRGGIDVPAVLGSRSTDALSGLGPAPLQAGDVLRGRARRRPGFPCVDVAHCVHSASADLWSGLLRDRVPTGSRTCSS